MSQKRLPTNKERNMLGLAVKQALTSSFPTYKHGAVMTKGSSIISLGVNKKQFNSFAARFRDVPENATVHAELCCVLGVDKRTTSGANIYVARVNNAGKWMMSKPCPMCQAALNYVGIKKVIYTIDEKHIGEMRL
jgi:tRNA(Arg) A34 adenosine deaminase TadA